MSEHVRGRAPAWLRGNRNLILFCSLMLVIVLLPGFERSQTGEVLLAVVSTLIIVVSVVVSGHSRLLFWITFVLAGPALALRALAFFDDSGAALLWSWVLSAAVLIAAMVRLLEDVFAPGAVSRDRLFGCVTAYLLIGALWCHVYAIISEVSPGAFSGLNASSKTLRIAEFAYFSFNVVTTVALTNVMPVGRTAQVAVLLQEFAAVFYMAFVIARLVGMYGSGPAPTGRSDGGDGDGATPKPDH